MNAADPEVELRYLIPPLSTVPVTYDELVALLMSPAAGRTTTLEICVVISIAHCSVLLRNVITSLLQNKLSTPSFQLQFTVDFVTLVLPMILGCTLLSSHDPVLVLVLVSLLILVVSVSRFLRVYVSPEMDATSRNRKAFMDIRVNARRPFITVFRSYVLIITAICILAVDMIIFPHRFSKAEVYGTGLMDTGVGLFIMANAIVSHHAKSHRLSEINDIILGVNHAKNSYTPISIRKSKDSSGMVIRKTLCSTVPLWLLGVLRVASLSLFNYTQPDQEYGRHWNFFFTLAVVKIVSVILLTLTGSRFSVVTSLGISLLYQWLLLSSRFNLRHYLLMGSDEAGSHSTGLLDANREGVFSCAGYVAIYLAGVQIGRYLHQERERVGDWLRAVLVLCLVDSVLWVSLHLLSLYVEPPSKKMANLSFIIWMCALTVFILVLGLICDVIFMALRHYQYLTTSHDQGEPHSRKDEMNLDDRVDLLEAVNRNALFAFITINLLTGIINSVTISNQLKPLIAFMILVLYMFSFSWLMIFVDLLNIKIKCW